MSHLSIVSTEDGSNTIFNSEVGENYHSRHGALQESRHVFLESGLEYFLNNNKKVLFFGEDLGEAKFSPTGGDLEGASILEVGFGTGLNFLLTADYCQQQNI